MSDSDLGYMVVFLILGVFWAAFTGLYASDVIQDIPGFENTDTGGALSLLSVSLSFMNPFSSMFNSEIAIINTFVFGPIGAILVFIGFRSLRGI